MSENSNLSYEEAIDFLTGRTVFGINLGLQRIERLLELMGQPQKSGVKYIHVAGTNGKGSVSAMLSDMLTACGYKTGLFTSPHLHSYTERIMIDRQPIAGQSLAELVQQVLPLLDRLEAENVEPPTEFEVLTALALQYFTLQGCDWAIIEVGMGGKIDSTNIIQPELAVITNVSMDHPSYLGSTIAEIAETKSGIIKPKIPAITGSREAAALAKIRARVADCESELLVIDQDFLWSDECCGQPVQKAVFHYRTADQTETYPFALRLLGRHQLDNAAIALAVVRRLGFDMRLCVAALQNTTWPGRLELLSTEPVILLDGAHNVGGMQTLVAALQAYWQGFEITALIGMLADKEREQALALLLPLVQQAVVTKVPSNRAGDWRLLGDLSAAAGVPVECIESVPAACARGLELFFASPEPKKLFLVTGSLYMLADARAYLLKKLPEILPQTDNN